MNMKGKQRLFRVALTVSFLSSLLYLIQTSSLSAQIYKWTDEDGQVHYGDRPGNPDSVQMQIRQPNSVSAADTLREKQRLRLLDVLNEERNERIENDQNERLVREERQTKCNEARRYLQMILTSGYLYKDTSDPLNPKILTNEERNAETLSAQNTVNEWCS